MRNKVEVINGAIGMCNRLINNETIQLNGLHKLSVTKGNISDSDLRQRIIQLHEERENLYNRIVIMGHYLK